MAVLAGVLGFVGLTVGVFFALVARREYRVERKVNFLATAGALLALVFVGLGTIAVLGIFGIVS
jgi:hypothetical protein